MSARRSALNALVTILRGVTPGAGYVNDLSGTVTVTIVTDSMIKRRESGVLVAVRVRDGAETAQRVSLTGGSMVGALSLVVELLVRSRGDTMLVDTTNDLIGDVRLAVDKNTRLQNTVTDAYVTVVGEPDYDFDGRVAAVTLVIAATYDYTQGASI
jgi:hypothetical protein